MHSAIVKNFVQIIDVGKIHVAFHGKLVERCFSRNLDHARHLASQVVRIPGHRLFQKSGKNRGKILNRAFGHLHGHVRGIADSGVNCTVGYKLPAPLHGCKIIKIKQIVAVVIDNLAFYIAQLEIQVIRIFELGFKAKHDVRLFAFDSPMELTLAANVECRELSNI